MSVLARNMGTEVPIMEVLDARLWVERYFWPVVDNLAMVPHPREAGKTLLDAIPPRAISVALASALSQVERRVNVQFGLIRHRAQPIDDGAQQGIDFDAIAERLPLAPGNWTTTGVRLQLPRDIVQVTRVRGIYLGQTVVDIDPTDATTGIVTRIDYGAGLLAVRLAPNWTPSGTASSLAWTSSWFTATVPVPAFWGVDYVTGYTSPSGRLGMIPAELADYVGMEAGIRLLNQVGTMQTKGVSSTSLGFDGFSKSVSLQASAMYGVNSSLETVYKDAMARIDLDKCRWFYHGSTVVGYGSA
jgi:hypothetical protein